jgi:transposase
MLTQGEDVEAHALRGRGWSISAIARHLGRNRRTVRSYLNGETVPGQRNPGGPDTFGVFEEYCRVRLRQDPHLQMTDRLLAHQGWDRARWSVAVRRTLNLWSSLAAATGS